MSGLHIIFMLLINHLFYHSSLNILYFENNPNIKYKHLVFFFQGKQYKQLIEPKPEFFNIYQFNHALKSTTPINLIN